MDLSSLLSGPMGETILSTISSQLGLDKNQAAGAAKVAIPAILSGLNKNAQSEDGAKSLDKALEKHDAGLLGNLIGMISGNSQDLLKDGGGILSHVFGDKLGEVEKDVSKKSGLSMSQVGSLMSILAPIVMSFLAKEKNDSKGGSGDLSSLIGGLLGGSTKKSSGGGLLGAVSGMLDKNKDGSIIDDVFDMFKK